MPSDWLYIDTNFPSFTGREGTEEKISSLQNYLYMLVEQLRYSLRNLDLSNMNNRAVTDFAASITEPIYARIEDGEGNTAQLGLTVEGLAARMSDAEGNISSLTLTAEGLNTRVSSAEGSISSLTLTAEGLQVSVSGLEAGQVNLLRMTKDGLVVMNGSGSAAVIDGGQIYADTLELTGSINIAGKFQVNHQGQVTWTAENSPVLAQYSTDGTGNWTSAFSTSDFFARYSYDGGLSWTPAIRIQGENGKDGSSASVPGYIKRTYIDEAKICAPDIYAGRFYATGKGAEEGAAYYIYDGCSISSSGSVTLGKKIGYISYDDNGTGSSTEAAERVFFTTLGGTALKIQSSGNMSLEAASFIYLHTMLRAFGGIRLQETVSYGGALPSRGEKGEIFFLI